MNHFPFKKQAGVTLVELILVIGIMSILIGFVTINLSNTQQKTSLSLAVTTLIADMKQQQLKAMIGDTEGRGTIDDYGVQFETDRYILFHGPSYVAADPSNFPIKLEGALRFTTLGSVITSKLGGEIPAVSTVTIQDSSTGEQKSLQINRYGVITQVN